MSQNNRKTLRTNKLGDKMKAVTLDRLTPGEWVEIKKEALRFLHGGSVKGDEFRATVWGFVFWLLKNNKVLEFEGIGPEDKIH